jgi:formate dehydrogenase
MKFLLVTYPDPETGHPTKYVRDSIPEIKSYPGGATTPTPEAISFKPGELLGDETGAFGIKSWLESLGHQVVVTTDKEGPKSEFERELVDADVVLSQPFFPAYMTAQRFDIAKNLKLCVTVGVGSDHYDLDAANEHKVTVAEVSYSNSRSVAEHIVMTALILVRNFVASHEVAKSGGWNIADCAERSYDLEGMHFGTIAAGRIGLDVLRKLKPFDVHLHYYDKHRLKPEIEKELGLIYHASVDEMLPLLDVLNISCPLHPETKGMVNAKFIAKCKRGVFIVNTARGGLCDENAVAEACKTGQIGGYGGDVWYPQPAPKDHPWRAMPYNAMVPHVSGTSLSAQTRYCAGTREILEAFLEGKPYRTEYLIADKGKLAGAGAHAYTTTSK